MPGNKDRLLSLLMVAQSVEGGFPRDHKLKNALLFTAVAWPVMMILAYLLSFAGTFSGTNMMAFGLLGFPALFVARLVSLHFFDRPRT
jgi:hypothetical protein